jgi:hypothetical protein
MYYKLKNTRSYQHGNPQPVLGEGVTFLNHKQHQNKTYQTYPSPPHHLDVCQSESSESGDILVGGSLERDRAKSSTSDLAPASTNLRKHQLIWTAVDFSFPRGSTCLALTTKTNVSDVWRGTEAQALTNNLVPAIFAIVHFVR